MTNTSTM